MSSFVGADGADDADDADGSDGGGVVVGPVGGVTAVVVVGGGGGVGGVDAVVVIFSHRHNLARGDKAGSDNSGVEVRLSERKRCPDQLPPFFKRT